MCMALVDCELIQVSALRRAALNRDAIIGRRQNLRHF